VTIFSQIHAVAFVTGNFNQFPDCGKWVKQARLPVGLGLTHTCPAFPPQVRAIMLPFLGAVVGRGIEYV
jgi:hypothetical protein